MKKLSLSKDRIDELSFVNETHNLYFIKNSWIFIWR